MQDKIQEKLFAALLSLFFTDAFDRNLSLQRILEKEENHGFIPLVTILKLDIIQAIYIEERIEDVPHQLFLLIQVLHRKMADKLELVSWYDCDETSYNDIYFKQTQDSILELLDTNLLSINNKNLNLCKFGVRKSSFPRTIVVTSKLCFQSQYDEEAGAKESKNKFIPLSLLYTKVKSVLPTDSQFSKDEFALTLIESKQFTIEPIKKVYDSQFFDVEPMVDITDDHIVRYCSPKSNNIKYIREKSWSTKLDEHNDSGFKLVRAHRSDSIIHLPVAANLWNKTIDDNVKDKSFSSFKFSFFGENQNENDLGKELEEEKVLGKEELEQQRQQQHLSNVHLDLVGPYPFLANHLSTLCGYPVLDKNHFTVMSYNILYRSMARGHNYCPGQYLDWRYRSKKIIDGISRALPSIICLQEVEHKYMEASMLDDIKKGIVPLGYKSMAPFAGKVNFNGQLVKNRFDSLQGPAIFIQDFSWDVEDQGRLNFAQELGSKYCIEGNFKRYTQACQSAPWVLLRHKFTNKLLVCVSTHICCSYLDGERDRQFAQVYALVKFLEEKFNFNTEEKIPIIIAGDFNSSPESALIEKFIKKGSIPYSDADTRPGKPYTPALHEAASFSFDREDMDISYDDEGPYDNMENRTITTTTTTASTNNTVNQCYEHSLNLCSLYHKINRQEPLLTTQKGQEVIIDPENGNITYRDGFIGALDYIFYTDNSGLKSKGCLPLPTLEQCEEGYPNKEHPSDHLPIGGVFSFEN